MDKRKKFKKKRPRKKGITQAQRKRQLIRRFIMGVAGVFIVLLLLTILINVVSGKKREAQEAKAQEAAAKAAAQKEAELERQAAVTPVSITVSAAGDCTLGKDEDFEYDSSFNAVYESVDDPAWFFENVRSIFEADDLTIVNLEGPLTTSDDVQEKTFAFKGDPEYVKILTEGSVEAANLANNHSHDYGESGYEDTIKNVEAEGIKTFGYDRTALMDVKGVKVGLAGIYVLADGMDREDQLREKIRELKEQGAQLVIVSFHWGSEKENYPDETQKTLAHIAVDEGADLVLGHHPHVLQGIETYQGKTIVYSLGNFCFGGNSSPSDMDTMIFQQTFTVTGVDVALNAQSQVIPCSISSASDYNNYQPTPAEGEEKTRIEERISEYSSGLTGSSDSDDSDYEE